LKDASIHQLLHPYLLRGIQVKRFQNGPKRQIIDNVTKIVVEKKIIYVDSLLRVFEKFQSLRGRVKRFPVGTPVGWNRWWEVWKWAMMMERLAHLDLWWLLTIGTEAAAGVLCSQGEISGYSPSSFFPPSYLTYKISTFLNIIRNLLSHVYAGTHNGVLSPNKNLSLLSLFNRKVMRFCRHWKTLKSRVVSPRVVIGTAVANNANGLFHWPELDLLVKNGCRII